MEELDFQEIRSWCREAQDYANELGVEEALSYLLGERFSPLVKSLRKSRDQVKYLYSERDRPMVQSLAEKDQSFRTGYLLAVETNYKKHLEQIHYLERLIDDFILEIKEAFEEQDVLDFLETYPRLSAKLEDVLDQDALKEPSVESLSDQDLMAEVEDIYLADEIRRLFQNKRLTR